MEQLKENTTEIVRPKILLLFEDSTGTLLFHHLKNDYDIIMAYGLEQATDYLVKRPIDLLLIYGDSHYMFHGIREEIDCFEACTASQEIITSEGKYIPTIIINNKRYPEEELTHKLILCKAKEYIPNTSFKLIEETIKKWIDRINIRRKIK